MHAIFYKLQINLCDKTTRSMLDHLLSSSIKLYLMTMHWWIFHKLFMLYELLNLLSVNIVSCPSKISLNYGNLYCNLTVFIFLTLINRIYHTMAEKKPLGGPCLTQLPTTISKIIIMVPYLSTISFRVVSTTILGTEKCLPPFSRGGNWILSLRQ